MSKARHTRTVVSILPPDGLAFWKADSYRVAGSAVAAAPDATWSYESPGAFYRLASKRREIEAGPHLSFLRLRAMMNEAGDLGCHSTPVELFSSTFGLLGLFNEAYLPSPLLPDRKLYIAPEAEIMPDGTLRPVDPLTEGLELVLELLARQHPDRWRPEAADAVRRKVALPSEVGLIPWSYAGRWKDMAYMPGSKPVAWTEAREPYGALFVLDPASSTRVSILSTREPLEPLIAWETAENGGPPVAASGWETALLDFPVPTDDDREYSPGDRGLRCDLNARLSRVSPYLPEDVDDFRQGWRCRSLLEAMALMLYLDLSGTSSIRECALHDCPNYFRLGSQSGSKYCSPKHTSLATTRRKREKQSG